jgi:hypothetical protein
MVRYKRRQTMRTTYSTIVLKTENPALKRRAQ